MQTLLHRRGDVFYVILRYRDSEGKRKDKRISTKTSNRNEAVKKMAEIVKLYENADLDEEAGPDMLVSAYLSRWKEEQRDKVEQSTFESYATYFGKHLIPHFANLKMKMRDLRPKHIQAYADALLKNGRVDKNGGLSSVMVRKIISLLKKALDDAVIAEIIPTNPAMCVKVKGKADESTKQQKHPLTTVGECQKVLDAFEGHYLKPLITMTVYYGLRRSEVLGLQWKSIDFANKTLKIEHTVVKNLTIVEKDTTKTECSRATLPLLDDIANMLRRLKANEQKFRELYGCSYRENDYVFKQDDGTPYRPDSVTRGFQRVLHGCGLDRMRFHDLRHSTASFLIDKGWSLNDVREWLRHADIETTANIYTHISSQKVVGLATDLNQTFHITGESGEPLITAGAGKENP